MLMTQAVMAENLYMRMRVASSAAKQGCTDRGIDPDEWSRVWRKVWSGAEGWDTKWEEAQAELVPSSDPMNAPAPLTGPVGQVVIDIGQDPDVITDQMIDDQVALMTPFIMVEANKPEVNPMATASRQFVQDMLDPTNRTISAMMEALVALRGGETVMIPPPPRH